MTSRIMSRVALLIVSFMWRTVERTFFMVKQVFFVPVKMPSRASLAPTGGRVFVGARLAREEAITDSNKTQTDPWCKLSGSSDSTHCEPYAVAFQTLSAAQTAQFSAERGCRHHPLWRCRVPSLPAGKNRQCNSAHLYRRAVPATG
ncbi:hypothetical protein EMIT0P253_20146 [Pseudomonas sp. IT-P253]